MHAFVCWLYGCMWNTVHYFWIMQIKINRERIEELHKQLQKQLKHDRVWTTEFVYEGQEYI